jgi:hypothetical protein
VSVSLRQFWKPPVVASVGAWWSGYVASLYSWDLALPKGWRSLHAKDKAVSQRADSQANVWESCCGIALVFYTDLGPSRSCGAGSWGAIILVGHGSSVELSPGTVQAWGYQSSGDLAWLEGWDSWHSRDTAVSHGTCAQGRSVGILPGFLFFLL